MAKNKVPAYKPGQKAPASGQYGVVGPKGGKTGTEITATKGETLVLATLPIRRNLHQMRYHDKPFLNSSLSLKKSFRDIAVDRRSLSLAKTAPNIPK